MFLRKYWARVKRWTTGTRELDSRWKLFIGAELLAELHYLGYEFPWVTCRFEPTSRFEHYEKYFESLNRPHDQDDGDLDVEDLLREIGEKGGYRLVGATTAEISPNPNIHIDDGYATFRP